jgi:acyl carrier protein
MNTQEKVSDFICKEFCGNDRSRVPAMDHPLLGSEGGPVDSVGLHQVISFLESDLGIVVGDLDIVPENFQTMRTLISYADRKRAEANA